MNTYQRIENRKHFKQSKIEIEYNNRSRTEIEYNDRSRTEIEYFGENRELQMFMWGRLGTVQCQSKFKSADQCQSRFKTETIKVTCRPILKCQSRYQPNL